MEKYWPNQGHVSPIDTQYSFNNNAQNFTLLVEDFQDSASIQDSTSSISSTSRPPTLRTTSSESDMSFASQTTVSSGSKRSRRESHNDQGDQDAYLNALRPQKRNKKATPVDSESTQLFACPYAKYEPSRYSASNLQELNYRSCSKCYLTDIARLKQHLYRVHERPKFHCSRCFEIFESQKILLDHVFTNSCTIQEHSSFEEKMTAEQSAIIRKKTRGVDPYLTWYDIYRTLFPGAPLPSTPYASFANQNSESLDAFVHFVQERLPQKVSEKLVGMSLMSGVHQDLVTSSIETCLATIMQEMRLDFTQSSRSIESPVALKASPAADEPSPMRLASEVKTEPVDDHTFYQPVSNDGAMRPLDNQNEDVFGSDTLMNDVAMELFGPTTAIYEPQNGNAEIPSVGDYFVGFHQAVTLPY